jgi:hypothetical protein
MKKKSAKKVTAVKKKTAPRKKRSAVPKSGLSGWMVVWHHTMDDIPVGLFADEKAAFKFAEKCPHKDAYTTVKNLGISCSTPLFFSVVHFNKGAAVDNFIVERSDDTI